VLRNSAQVWESHEIQVPQKKRDILLSLLDQRKCPSFPEDGGGLFWEERTSGHLPRESSKFYLRESPNSNEGRGKEREGAGKSRSKFSRERARIKKEKGKTLTGTWRDARYVRGIFLLATKSRSSKRDRRKMSVSAERGL